MKTFHSIESFSHDNTHGRGYRNLLEEAEKNKFPVDPKNPRLQSRNIKSVAITFLVWAFFSSSAMMVAELFPIMLGMSALIFSILISLYVFYDTILLQRFTPVPNFFLALGGMNIVLFCIRIVYYHVVFLEPYPDFSNITITYFIWSIFVSPIAYLILYRNIKPR